MDEAEIQTPCLILDLDALERNIRKMGDAARAMGMRHRVHGKMHKSVDVALLQERLGGSVGVCCQKVFGYQPQTLKFRFQPLREMTTEQHSSILTQRMNRILAAFQNGVITEKTAAEQINAENIFSQPIPVNEALSLDEVHEIRQSKPAPTTPGYGAGTSVVTT
jgi:hypothetical protein